MVHNWSFETNSSVLPLTKILVTVDQIQEALLSSRIETTVTSINETWIQCLTNNEVFQIGWTIDLSTGKFSHYRIRLFGGKTLLL